MRIVRIEIENFRPIRRVARDLGEMTVLDGPDNAGRTAFLEPLRLALQNSSGQLGSSSTEHDVHFTISASAALTKTKAEEIRAELHSTGKKTEDNWGAAGKGGLSATWNATGFRQTDGRSPPPPNFIDHDYYACVHSTAARNGPYIVSDNVSVTAP